MYDTIDWDHQAAKEFWGSSAGRNSQLNDDTKTEIKRKSAIQLEVLKLVLDSGVKGFVSDVDSETKVLSRVRRAPINFTRLTFTTRNLRSYTTNVGIWLEMDLAASTTNRTWFIVDSSNVTISV